MKLPKTPKGFHRIKDPKHRIRKGDRTAAPGFSRWVRCEGTIGCTVGRPGSNKWVQGLTFIRPLSYAKYT